MHALGSKMNKMKNCSRRLPHSNGNDCLPIRVLEEEKCEYDTTCKFVDYQGQKEEKPRWNWGWPKKR